ncbi:MAG TPA: AAA family ATPase [Candidatus Saccharimonadales bacterium]|nr:AAA family ATPase [Candidatus Saccharimonadales bacterium]
MTDLIFHDSTKKGIRAFIAHPSHAVLLVGPAGAGKETVARHIASELLKTSLEKLAAYPYLSVVTSEDSKSIGIDEVRELQHFASLKIPRSGQYNRIIIIGNAHRMTQEAQNALLKLIEEPPEATLIVLTTPAQQALLPTITSRCQLITIHPLEESQAMDYFRNRGHNATQLQRAWLISGGLAGLMSALLVADSEHPLVQAAATARELLQTDAFERLVRVDELSKQPANTMRDVLLVLQQMARIALARPASSAVRGKWQSVLQGSYDTITALDKGAQAKLALTNLMLNL